MTHRWTLAYQRIETQDPSRSSGVRMRSSGLRYWLLVPFAVPVFYYAIIWSTIAGLSFLSPLGRYFRRRNTSV